MTTLILVRHGQSYGNLEHRFCGQTDVPLTELGREQAAMTAAYLASRHFDALYASPLSRAFDTGHALAERIGLPILPMDALMEINAGSWEGLPYAEFAKKTPKAYDTWLHDIGHAALPDGETVLELGERVYRAICEICRKHPGKTVGIFTHATPIRTLTCHFRGIPVEEAASVAWVPNASVTTVLYDPDTDRATILELGYDAHMGEKSTTNGKDI